MDEAQYLNTGILGDLKMLANCGYDSASCFMLILFGETRFNDTLCRPARDALRQRIAAHWNHSDLSDDEVSKYIFHKIRIAGGSETIMHGGDLSVARGCAQGNPRLIDNLMTDALVLGAQLQGTVIDAEIIRCAAENLALS